MYNLCCICTALPKSRIITYKSYAQHPIRSRLEDIYLHNFDILNKTLKYCAARGWGLRISSSLMPLFSHPEVNYNYRDSQIISEAIQKCRQTIDSTRIRVSMHPGPYNVLESGDERVVNNAVKELNWHGWLLDELGCERSARNPINTHIHTSTGDKMTLIGRFIRGFRMLDDSVKSRLTIENNDKGGVWHCQGLLEFREIAREYIGDIPLCYDNLHDKLLRSPDMSPEECFHAFYDTWGGTVPIFHHSESNGGVSHNDMPSFVPNNYGKVVDWDVELKGKDDAIRALEKLTQ